MINFALVKPEYNTHLVNAEGVILDTTVNKGNSVIAQKVIGTLATSYIHPDDAIHFSKTLGRAIYDGRMECCEYRIANQHFKAKFEKIAVDRVRIVEWNITGLDVDRVWQLPW